MKDSLLQHHATGFVGDSAAIISRISDIVDIKGNPDFFHEKFEVLTIDDSRRIREIHESRPFSADVPRIFVIELHGATREAQNALLKTLEEPRPDNYFFIAVPSIDILLPTVRSRLYIMDTVSVDEAGGADMEKTNEAKTFLKMPLAEKIAFADDLAARISDEKATKHDAISFLNSLERAVYVARPKKNFSEKERTVFTAIDTARIYLNDRAPSVKMLLEYIALSADAR